MSVKCTYCGKFAKIVDSYTPYGTYRDYEPPDEVLLCQKCVDETEQFCLKLGRPPSEWRKSKFSRRVAKKLGFIEVYDKGCAWSYWVKDTTPLKDGTELVKVE